MANDACGTVRELLSNNWDNSNTNLRTPTFMKVYDAPSTVDLHKDYIFFYSSGDTDAINGIGSNKFKEAYVVTIDIRTAYIPSENKALDPLDTEDGHTHMLNVLEEIKRIIKENLKTPGGNFEVMRPTGSSPDLSDKRSKMYRKTYDVMLIITNN